MCVCAYAGMLGGVRTTINLPDALGEAAKRRAAEQGQTFTSLVERGLRAVLADEGAAGEPDAFPTSGDPHAAPLVDLRDREALWEAFDADGPR